MHCRTRHSRSASLVRARADTTYQVGDQVNLQTEELLDTDEESTLDGAFRAAAVAGPNTYTPTLQARSKCNPTATDDRLKLCFLRVGSTTWVRLGIRGGATPQPQDGVAGGPITWCGGRATPRRTTRGVFRRTHHDLPGACR